ncbi:hypothetical protein N431DRAFT_441561 [Stipitochalara longipes BDJ]|nr:hypothetical protein N431DRAFT_441561 [Stipitochalara longipes BDJ]
MFWKRILRFAPVWLSVNVIDLAVWSRPDSRDMDFVTFHNHKRSFDVGMRRKRERNMGRQGMAPWSGEDFEAWMEAKIALDRTQRTFREAREDPEKYSSKIDGADEASSFKQRRRRRIPAYNNDFLGA